MDEKNFIQKTGSPQNSNLSHAIFHLNFAIVSIIIISLVSSIVIRPVLNAEGTIIDLLVGFPAFLVLVINPVGVYYSIQSIRRKEGSYILRNRIMIGNLTIFLLLLFFILFFLKTSEAK